MKFVQVLLSVFVVVYCDDCVLERENSEVVSLKRNILASYEKDIPDPCLSNVVISMKLVPTSMNLDVMSQVVTFNGWIVLDWEDSRLSWTTSIENLYVSSSEIWVPEMSSIITNHHHEAKSLAGDANCEITSLGNVYCVPTTSNAVVCKSDLRRFPYDEISCELFYNFWAMGENVTVQLSDLGVDFEEFVESPDFYVTNWEFSFVDDDSLKDLCVGRCKENSTPIAFYFTLRRHTGKYNLLFSTMSVMVLLTLVAFWLPTESMERFVMVLSNLLLHLLYGQEVFMQVPYADSSVPSILLFYRDSTVLTAIVCLFTLCLRRMHFAAFVDKVGFFVCAVAYFISIFVNFLL